MNLVGEFETSQVSVSVVYKRAKIFFAVHWFVAVPITIWWLSVNLHVKVANSVEPKAIGWAGVQRALNSL